MGPGGPMPVDSLLRQHPDTKTVRIWVAVFMALIPNSIGLFGQDQAPANRHFELRVAATVNELEPDVAVRIWMPVPSTSSDQVVEVVSQSFPAEARLTSESRFGNRMMYCETVAPESGQLAIAMTFDIRRIELLAAEKKDFSGLGDQERKDLLGADRMVPVAGKPQEMLLNGVKLPDAAGDRARMLYDIVDNHMTYDKSHPGYGNGDVLWACDSRTGNCTDFHSLFISLARSQNIPAVFEIGFPLPVERGVGTIAGYHCWAKFFLDDRGWVPVDISEADKAPEMKDYYFGNLTENRVAFSRGRDIVLEPAQTAGPLNYFVYPYVEADDQAVEKENLKLDIQFRDLD